MTLEERWQLTNELLARQLAVVNNRKKLGTLIMSKGRALVIDALERLLPQPPAAPAPTADLRSTGGIRTDAEGIENAKKLAVELAKQSLDHQVPQREWEKSIVADLVKLIQQAGGQVVFYEMPLHSVQAAPYQTPLRQADRVAFRQQATEWNCRYLEPDFVAPDVDFPDYWHLRKSRSQEFATKLAEAWYKASSE
jgi:hypothetical protein